LKTPFILLKKMEIKKHAAENYRNITKTEFEPSPGINVIYGENGQGKTNIIESIWLFTGCQSFRTRKCGELVKENELFARTEIDFFARNRLQNAQMTIDTKRQVKLNGILQETPRKLLGEFQAVVFSPSSLAVVKDGPAEKRRFLDIAISLIKPNYACLISRYLKAMAHRNALLKQLGDKGGHLDLLEPWDEELSRIGAKILMYRYNYIEELKETATQIYAGISSGRETLTIGYVQSFKAENRTEKDLKAAMLLTLEKNRQSDIRRQITCAGPHKDDLSFEINGLCARSYGSQGQQRSCALALKLGEAAVLRASGGEQPVALLDDVMSELDSGRQSFLLDFLEGWQVFITCCDPSILSRVNTGKIFEVNAGQIKESGS
jgi:DNA replication and repair protein RecF